MVGGGPGSGGPGGGFNGNRNGSKPRLLRISRANSDKTCFRSDWFLIGSSRKVGQQKLV